MRCGMKKVLMVLLSVISVSSFAGVRAHNPANTRMGASLNQTQQHVFAQKFLKATTVNSATSAALTTARVTKIAKRSITTSLVG
jgi:hypothetical protein